MMNDSPNRNSNPIARRMTRHSMNGFRDEWLKQQEQSVTNKSISPCDGIDSNSLTNVDSMHSTQFLETLNLKSKEKPMHNGDVSFSSQVFLSDNDSLEDSKNEELSEVDTNVNSSANLSKMNTGENQDSLGKTLAYSLQLIAAGNTSVIPQLSSVSDEVNKSSSLSFNRRQLKNETPDTTGEECIDLKEGSPPRSRYITRSTLFHNDNQEMSGGNKTKDSTVEDHQNPPINGSQDSKIKPDNRDIPEEKEKQPTVTKRRGRRKKESVEPPVDKENVYLCSECGKSFNKSQTLRQHFITHTDRFACSFCDVRCKSKGDLRSHTQTHTKEKPFRCEVCNTFYTRESILKKHKLTQLHKNACFQLGNQLQLALKGEISETLVLRKGKYLCQQCPKKFSSRLKLKQHFKIHLFTFPCPQCQKRCKTSLTLKMHQRCHVQTGSIPCKFCSRIFPSPRLLRDHIKSAHAFLIWQRKLPGNMMKTFLAQRVESIADLRAEICRSVNPAARLVCGVCSRNFKSKKAYEKHCAKHAEANSDSPSGNVVVDQSSARKLSKYHCSECTRSFAYFDEYSKHHADHHNDKQMTCHICYTQFDCSTQFKSHVQNHGPTMLFSGASLEESKVPHIQKRNKRPSNARLADPVIKIDDEKEDRNIDKERSQADVESDDENFLESPKFIHMISAALNDNSDEEKGDEDSCDEEELYIGLKMLLYDSDQECFEKVANYKHEDTVVKKPEVDIEMFCEQDDKNSFYKCTPCDMLFTASSQLKDHMKSHVCSYCNIFCQNKESMAQHFQCQEKEQKAQEAVKNEPDRVEIDNDEISELQSEGSTFSSDDEMNEVFLDELEGILEHENKTAPSMEFFNTFSHDEIIRTNKKIFERYSCIDVPTNIYACIICKRKYARPTTLTRHFKTHVCPFCNTFFVDKSDLTDHKYKHRKKAAMIKAELSGESNSKMPRSPLVSKVNRELFKKFTIIDSSRNMNKCCLCDKLFVRKTVLTRHMKTHVCSYCDKFFEDKYELARHVGLHKMDSHIPEDDSVHRQYRVYDDEKPFVPNSAFSNQLEDDGKIGPMRSSYSANMPQFTATFSTPSTNSHDTVTFIQIPVSETCTDPNSVAFGPGIAPDASNYQMVSDPIVPNQGSFIVGPPTCHGDDSNKLLALTQDHMVTGDRYPIGTTDLFQCNICSKTFFKSGHLKSHISTHAAPAPYACRYCGKTFVRNGPLQKHEKTHDVKRCDHCDLSFTCQYELDHHMQIHESYPFYK